jgi:hypothetical protein
LAPGQQAEPPAEREQNGAVPERTAIALPLADRA